MGLSLRVSVVVHFVKKMDCPYVFLSPYDNMPFNDNNNEEFS